MDLNFFGRTYSKNPMENNLQRYNKISPIQYSNTINTNIFTAQPKIMALNPVNKINVEQINPAPLLPERPLENNFNSLPYNLNTKSSQFSYMTPSITGEPFSFQSPLTYANILPQTDKQRLTLRETGLKGVNTLNNLTQTQLADLFNKGTPINDLGTSNISQTPPNQPQQLNKLSISSINSPPITNNLALKQNVFNVNSEVPVKPINNANVINSDKIDFGIRLPIPTEPNLFLREAQNKNQGIRNSFTSPDTLPLLTDSATLLRPNVNFPNAGRLTLTPAISPNFLSNYFPIENLRGGEKTSSPLQREYYVQNSASVKEFAYKEDQNLKFRNYMEDKGVVVDGFNDSQTNALFCLFDGHGGSQVADYLQANYPNLLKNIIRNKNNINILKSNQYLSEYIPILPLSFKKIDEEIRAQNWFRVGSTGTVVFFTVENGRRFLYAANVGDTRCVVIRENGPVRITVDHRAGDAVEKKRIISSGGFVLFGRVFGQLMLSRTFGDFEFKNNGVIVAPYIYRKEIEDADKYVVLACDGVWDVISDYDMFELSKKISNAKEYCDLIMKDAVEKDATDNLSCFVIRVNY